MHNGISSPEDRHEPMEVEEISFSEGGSKGISDNNAADPFVLRNIKKEPKDDTERPEVPRAKIVIRESRLKLPERKKPPEPEAPSTEETSDEDEVVIVSNGSEERKTPIDEDPDHKRTKTKLRSLVKEDASLSIETETSYCFYFWQMIFFILFPIAVLVACVSIAREGFDSESCAHRFDATGAIGNLENRIFGQSQGIEELGKFIETNSSGLKVLAIIGGTGVGKSYAVHIIGENFPVKKNVFQYVPPLKPKRKFASGAISVCGCNLIVLENLRNRDIPEAARFAEYIGGKIDEVNYCVFIINVINVQETDSELRHDVNLARSKTNLENIYREKNFDVKVVQFQHLDDEAVTKCIIHAAQSRNITLSKNEIDDVRISLQISDSGCKGAHAKVQLLDKKLDLD